MSNFKTINRLIPFAGLCLLLIAVLLISQNTSANLNAIDADPSVSGRFVYAGIGAPVDMDYSGIEGDERVFVTEKGGSIRITGVPYNAPFFDITEKVDRPSEKGMLGTAFDPDFENNGFFYVFYTGPFDETQDPPTFTTKIERYSVSDDPNFADPDSAFTILEIEQTSNFHNGGNLVFGPDGYLYIGVGDDNIRREAQNLGSLLGKVLRIDIDPDGGLPADCDTVSGNYSIPADNPFAGQADTCGEVWAYGVRNPWRFTFDPVTSQMFLGDVGDESFEELNWAAAGEGGQNYGWPYFEGSGCVGGVFAEDCVATTNHVTPIYEYPHSEGGGSITGGYVYRGADFPNLYGHYVFGDFTNSVIYTAIFEEGGWQVTNHGPMLTEGAPLISAFGTDPEGELFAVRFTDGNPTGSTGNLWRVIDEYGFDLKLEAPASVPEGSAIEYTLTVTNVGSQPATDIVISNKVPAGASHQSGGNLSGDTVLWTIDSLGVEETAVVSWIAAPQSATVTNDDYTVSAGGEPPVVGREAVTTTASIGVGGRLFQDFNENGLMDDFELGVGDTTVKLWKDDECDGQIQSGGLIGELESEADGSYFFGLDNPDFSICYLLKIELGTLPNDVSLTMLNVGDDESVDSDFYPNGWTDLFQLPIEPMNGGFVGFDTVPPPTATPIPTETPVTPSVDVFGRIFEDQNANGVDDGEPGVAGIEVTLYRDANCDGETAGPDIIGRIDSSANGSYQFAVDNTAGCFLLKADVNDLPAGWIVTERDAGTNDSIDSDVFSFGWTDIFTLPIQAINAGVYNPAFVTPEPPIEPTAEPTSTPVLLPSPTVPIFGTPPQYPATSTPISANPPVIGPDYEPIFMPLIVR